MSISVSPPVAPQTSLLEGDKVTLTGTATEPGVDLTNLSKASYLWTVTGPNGFSQVGVQPVLKVVPLVAGTYTATLTVRDFTGGSGSATRTFNVAHAPPRPILRYLNTGTDGTTSFQAVVSNPGGVYTFSYTVTLNGQPYIPQTAGGAAFTFRIPPVTGPTRVRVSVTDSVNATGQISTTVRTVAAGTAATPVLKSVTAADLFPDTDVAVVLALGFNQITADPSLTAATTVQFIAVGGNNRFFGGAATNVFFGDSGTNEPVRRKRAEHLLSRPATTPSSAGPGPTCSCPSPSARTRGTCSTWPPGPARIRSTCRGRTPSAWTSRPPARPSNSTRSATRCC